MPVEIRHGTEDDLFSLQQLYRQLHPEDTADTLEELTDGFHAMCNHPGCEFYVAESEGNIVGTFVLYILPNITHHGRPAAMLENIVVDEAYRRRGIGREMLKFASSVAQEHGCYKLSLTSNAKRAEAHEFYRRCGMQQHGVSFRYEL
jgi:GNAT superfamily N-acetyltransferase